VTEFQVRSCNAALTRNELEASAVLGKLERKVCTRIATPQVAKRAAGVSYD